LPIRDSSKISNNRKKPKSEIKADFAHIVSILDIVIIDNHNINRYILAK
jgi:hypothetical protein